MRTILFFTLIGCSFATPGQTVWSRQIGGPGSDEIFSFEVDSLGNSFITGVFWESVTIGNTTLVSAGSSDIFVAKVAKDGTFLWAKSFGGPEEDFGRWISLDRKGNFYLAGRYSSEVLSIDAITLHAPPNRIRVLVAKFNSDGVVQWVRDLAPDNSDVFGFDVNDKGESVLFGMIYGEIDMDGAVLLSNGDGTSGDQFAICLDPDGNLKWGRALEMPLQTSIPNSWPVAACIDNNGNSYLGGDFEGTVAWDGNQATTDPGDYDIFIAKFDDRGICQWVQSAQRKDPFLTYRTVEFGDLIVDKQDDVYMTGVFFQDLKLGSTTLNADIENGTSFADIFLFKLDGEGQPQWARAFGAAGYDQSWNLVFDKNENIYVSGSGWFNMDVGSLKITSETSYPFFAQFDKNGNALSADKVGETSLNTTTMALDPDGNLMFAGGFFGPFKDRNPAFSFANHSSDPAYDDAFLLKYRVCTDSHQMNFTVLNPSEMFFPNVFTPNGDSVNQYFKFDNRLIGGNLKVINRWGKEVYSSESYSNDWNGDDLLAGVYYYLLKKECMIPVNGIVTILR